MAFTVLKKPFILRKAAQGLCFSTLGFQSEHFIVLISNGPFQYTGTNGTDHLKTELFKMAPLAEVVIH